MSNLQDERWRDEFLAKVRESFAIQPSLVTVFQLAASKQKSVIPETLEQTLQFAEHDPYAGTKEFALNVFAAAEILPEFTRSCADVTTSLRVWLSNKQFEKEAYEVLPPFSPSKNFPEPLRTGLQVYGAFMNDSAAQLLRESADTVNRYLLGGCLKGSTEWLKASKDVLGPEFVETVKDYSPWLKEGLLTLADLQTLEGNLSSEVTAKFSDRFNKLEGLHPEVINAVVNNLSGRYFRYRFWSGSTNSITDETLSDYENFYERNIYSDILKRAMKVASNSGESTRESILKSAAQFATVGPAATTPGAAELFKKYAHVEPSVRSAFKRVAL